MVGRPTKYTKELADIVCERLAQGISMRSISKNEDMPAMSTLFKWLREIPEFSEQYAKAKQESADAMAEEVLFIADNQQLGVVKTTKQNGVVEVKEEDMLGHRRLQIDTRKWLMAKMKPKKYGEKLDVTSDGEKLGATISAEQSEQLIRARANRTDS